MQHCWHTLRCRKRLWPRRPSSAMPPAPSETVMDHLDEKRPLILCRCFAELGHESRSSTLPSPWHSKCIPGSIGTDYTAPDCIFFCTKPKICKRKITLSLSPRRKSRPIRRRRGFRRLVDRALEDYLRLSDILQRRPQGELMEQGIDEKPWRRRGRRRWPLRMRFVLPNACDTKMIVTMNA